MSRDVEFQEEFKREEHGMVAVFIARSAGCARICSCACSRATWNGIFAAPWRRCCLTTGRCTRPAAPATRSPPPSPPPRAREKKARQRTDDGLALHSLDTLITELATRCRNTCRVLSDPAAPPFALLTEPCQTQRRAAQLIEMFPVPGLAKI